MQLIGKKKCVRFRNRQKGVNSHCVLMHITNIIDSIYFLYSESNKNIFFSYLRDDLTYLLAMSSLALCDLKVTSI